MLFPLPIASSSPKTVTKSTTIWIAYGEFVAIPPKKNLISYSSDIRGQPYMNIAENQTRIASVDFWLYFELRSIESSISPH